jgi:hypothetical protein
MMHPALWQLLWFDLRGSFRNLLAIRRNWRRVGLLLFMLLFLGVILGTQSLTNSAGSGAGGRFGDAMPFWASLYLIGTWLTASADRGLVMRPAEIHFIVAGPFPTRDVITLNLVRLAYRASISALVLALVSLGFTQSFLGSLLGLWLLITVSLLVGMVVALASRKVHSVWVHRSRPAVDATGPPSRRQRGATGHCRSRPGNTIGTCDIAAAGLDVRAIDEHRILAVRGDNGPA